MTAFQYRTVGKVEYVARHGALDKSLTVSRAYVTDVDYRDLCFAKLQLSVDFRFIEKLDLSY